MRRRSATSKANAGNRRKEIVSSAELYGPVRTGFKELQERLMLLLVCHSLMGIGLDHDNVDDFEGNKKKLNQIASLHLINSQDYN